MGILNNKQIDKFRQELEGKNIPVVTLDNKWYRLLSSDDRKTVKESENELNGFLRKQGKLNSESRDIKRLKKKLMNEIVPMVDDAEAGGDPDVEKKLTEHKRLIEECNEKLEKIEDELLDIPQMIKTSNQELMMETIDCCYGTIQENTEEIKEIEAWVKDIRIQLKKQLIKKQELEQKNHEIYSYMHDIFGPQVMDLFDLKYDPESQHPVIPEEE